MRTHSRNFCQPVTNAISSSFLLREGERKKKATSISSKRRKEENHFSTAMVRRD